MLNSNLDGKVMAEYVLISGLEIGANSSRIYTVNGFSGKGNTIACIINSTYDYIFGGGHMNAQNTTMTATIHNSYGANQTPSTISCIRLYI